MAFENPFAALATDVSPVVMQIYVVVMVLFVAGGTLFDILHKQSARYFFRDWRNTQSKGTGTVGGGQVASLAVKTVASEIVTSSEFCNARRRVAHLLTMYGFLAYAIATAIMVFGYTDTTAPTPAILPILWTVGALMVCVGGYWFWFFIRADVSAEGHSPFRLIRADLFILSLLASTTFGLIWSFTQPGGTWWARPLPSAVSDRDDRAVRIGPLVQILAHVLQAGGSAPETGGGGERNPPQPAGPGGPPGDLRQRAPPAQPLLKPPVTGLLQGSLRKPMPTFVYMTSCDGCGHCVDICPSDIMHIDKTYRRAYNIEPNMCWECYACVKACPQNAIDCRGYADFAPLGHSVRALREEEKGTISWKIKFRNGNEKNFVSPIRTTNWGTIQSPADYAAPGKDQYKSQELAHEPDALNIEGGLPALAPDRLKQGVV